MLVLDNLPVTQFEKSHCKFADWVLAWNEVFRIAKEELDEDHAVLDAYVAVASSYVKLTPEKRSKETSLDENASDSGI